MTKALAWVHLCAWGSLCFLCPWSRELVLRTRDSPFKCGGGHVSGVSTITNMLLLLRTYKEKSCVAPYLYSIMSVLLWHCRSAPPLKERLCSKASAVIIHGFLPDSRTETTRYSVPTYMVPSGIRWRQAMVSMILLHMRTGSKRKSTSLFVYSK